ncbi:MAG: redoxin family protein [Pseudomonadales bacterium]|nr:redoxin family protein [Pseudomonadales bacterium]
MEQTIPNVVFKTRVRDESLDTENPFRWQDVSSDEIFNDKTVIVLALPGAFTPTCSSTHLPGFEGNYDELRKAGVDEIYCLSVNDAFSMFQWGKQLGISKVKMLPDGNADFTRAMDMLVKKENLGFGDRSWRYSMLVENGEVTKIFAEAGKSDNCESDPFEVSDAETMLNFLRARQSHSSTQSEKSLQTQAA